MLETVYWDTGTARLLPRLLKGRTRGPVFLTHRRPSHLHHIETLGRLLPARDPLKIIPMRVLGLCGPTPSLRFTR